MAHAQCISRVSGSTFISYRHIFREAQLNPQGDPCVSALGKTYIKELWTEKAEKESKPGSRN